MNLTSSGLRHLRPDISRIARFWMLEKGVWPLGRGTAFWRDWNYFYIRLIGRLWRGEGIQVWVDKWLPSLPLGHSSPLGKVAVTRNTRENSLICQSARDWDISFLTPFLSSME